MQAPRFHVSSSQFRASSNIAFRHPENFTLDESIQRENGQSGEGGVSYLQGPFSIDASLARFENRGSSPFSNVSFVSAERTHAQVSISVERKLSDPKSPVSLLSSASLRSGPDRSEKGDFGRFPTLLCGITLALTFVTFALVVWSVYGKYGAAESYRNRESRIRTLHGIILKEQQKRLDRALVQARQRATLSLSASAALLLLSISTWIVIIGRLRGMQGRLEDGIAQRTADLSAANAELLAARDAREEVMQVNAQLGRQSALILNSATDGILGVNLDNRATFLNPAGARMVGITLNDLKTRSIHQAIHHSYPDGTPWPEEDCASTQAMRRGESFALRDDTFWRSDGTSFPVEYSSTSLLDEDGNKCGAVVVFRDVTERRAVERVKSEFVSTVSHELRTPLTSIRGALGLLSSGLLGPIAEKGQRMLEIAVSNTDRLVRLINEILDLERIESGKADLALGSVDANVVAVEASEGVQSMADEAGVRIIVAPASGALWGDSDRIIQTLTNLLSNAIKFSPRDTTVTLSGTTHETDFVFCVADQGRGVPEQMLETIFDRFSQVDASDSRDKGGSGLGLAICQSIVVAHGGRIWAEKNEPSGSRFQFTIPLEVSMPLIVDDLSQALDLPSDSPSILVVEDDLDLARVMTASLQSHGIRIFHAVNGSQAIQLCRQHVPSLIVLDLILPDMDAFAVVNSLRGSPALRRIPLIVYSALDVGVADRPRLHLGPTEFLTKSRCSPAAFDEHVVRLLRAVTSGNAERNLAA